MGRALKSLREAQGKTQAEAALAMGVSRNAWQNYENGRAIVMRSDVQRRLVKALGADEDDLAAHKAAAQALGGRGPAVIHISDRPRQSEPARGQAVFPLSEGEVTVTFPPNLSNEGFAELAQYLSVFLRSRGVALS